MKINDLKDELKEKEKGCGKIYELEDKESSDGKWEFKCNEKHLCPSCQSKIEYPKKGIEACEERDKKIIDIIETFDYEKFISIGINSKGKLDDKDMLFTDEGIKRLKERIQQLTNSEEK